MNVPARVERYFTRMNAARDDKARLIPWLAPGTIVEVGPGGGVLLDLIADALPTSAVIGLDVSPPVVAALAARAAREGRRWTVVEADAFALPTRFGPGTVDSVVLCSVLHEIYSYLERPGPDGAPRRYQLAPVRELCQAAFATLAPGGRLVIRDGIAPPPGTRRLRLIAPDAAPLFARFVAEFRGRPIVARALAPDRVELSSADAMEFLYTYTWGEASFDHEVEEQYGILAYDDYAAAVLAWCGGPAHATLVSLPDDLRSYLQPGYPTHLAGKIELTDGDDQPVPLPDSNAVIVVERR